jgi:hypothetical protein
LYSCQDCDQKFSLRSSLEFHRYKKHGEPFEIVMKRKTERMELKNEGVCGGLESGLGHGKDSVSGVTCGGDDSLNGVSSGDGGKTWEGHSHDGLDDGNSLLSSDGGEVHAAALALEQSYL